MSLKMKDRIQQLIQKRTGVDEKESEAITDELLDMFTECVWNSREVFRRRLPIHNIPIRTGEGKRLREMLRNQEPICTTTDYADLEHRLLHHILGRE